GTNGFPSNYTTNTLFNSTVYYEGSNQPVAGLTYSSLNIAGTGTKTLQGTATINGSLTVAASTFDLGTFTANRSPAGGALTVSNGATLKIGGTNSFPTNYASQVLGATSTVEYAGTTQTISATPAYG